MSPIHRLSVVLMVICLLAITVTTALFPIDPNAAATKERSADEYRLPTAFTPEYYKLEVITHLGDTEGFRFNGNVRIKINCLEDTDQIVLHSSSLVIDEAAVKLTRLSSGVEKQPPTDVVVKGIELEEERDFLTVRSGELLTNGSTYELYLTFEAPLESRLHGYYLSSYVDRRTNKKQYLSITQFEATYARFAFPCFDEPAMKARFEISLAHEKSFIALSNMPIRATEEFKGKSDWQWDHFDVSVPMSTYLIAYSINSFEYREAVVQMEDEVVFRIYARPDAIDQVEYAKSLGPKVLKFYENYFDIKFPLPKMDMMAVPDFSAGAMENWGLVTYRESYLLYSPEKSSTSNQQAVASVVAHELAHQWFGNLVTMEWWGDLWLNEGFATYVASLGVHSQHPEWNSFEEESLRNTHNIFNFDALRSSHPVKVEIKNPATIFQIFDNISYRKGSSIIRMMHRFLGEEAFRQGVHNYLKRHEYGNAEQDNLWESLTEEAHRQGSLPDSLTVKEIMDTWTLQTGYPTVTVLRDYMQKTATVTQRRTFANTLRVRTPDEENCWWVPLSYTTSKEIDFNDTSAKDWLECDGGEESTTSGVTNCDKTAKTTTLVGQPSENEWVLYNIDLSGLYKVQYDSHNWDLLSKQLRGPDFKNIGAINRAQLIDDSLELAWTGEQNYSIALQLMDYLKNEDEYIPWSTALGNLNRLRGQLKRTPKYGQFKEYMRNMIRPVYERIGGLNAERNDGDRTDVIKQKVQISTNACNYGISDCVNKAIAYLAKWMATAEPDTNNPIPTDIRQLVYCSAVRHGGEAEWDFLWARYLKSNVASERNSILHALGYTREVWLLARYLGYTLDDSIAGIRKQDFDTVFDTVSHNEVGYFFAKEFFEKNLQTLHDKLAPDTSKLTRYIKSLASQMTSLDEAAEFKEFLDQHQPIFVQNGKGIEQALETIEINSQWRQKNYQNIGRYLQEFSNV